MANGKTNKESKVNKPTGSYLDSVESFDQKQTRYRREAGVEIKPAKKK
jgi:hypothetical protein